MHNLIEHLDTSVLDELRDIMEDEFELLIRTFIKDSAVHLENIERYARNRAHDELRRSAHSLKGSSVNVGANQLHDLCADLEKSATDEIWSRVGDQIGKVEQEYQAVIDCLQQLLSADKA